ncbi:MAG: S26 family signal peptidase [Planctomycetota bacterium]
MSAPAVPGSSARSRCARRILSALLWTAALVIGLLAFVRVAVGWVFPVASWSMWPTLKPGEWVFMRWDRTLPERFDLLAFRSESGEAVVKRVWGLPGETVLIEPSGDVRVESKLDLGPGRPAPVCVFDSRLCSVEDAWNHGGTEHDPWARIDLADGGVAWEVDSRALHGRYDASLLRYHPGVHDDHLDADGTLVAGTVTANDLILSADVFVVEGGGDLRFELREQGDRLEFCLELPRESGPATGALRRLRGERKGPATTQVFDVPVGQWFHVRFANIDDELIAEVDDAPPLRFPYGQNTPHAADLDGDGRVDVEGTALGERAFLGADEARVRFRAIRLERDIHVPAFGTFGVGRELKCGPNEVYVLGDNPTRSRDSREFGPVLTQRFIGRPERVVWPPSAWRRVRR